MNPLLAKNAERYFTETIFTFKHLAVRDCVVYPLIKSKSWSNEKKGDDLAPGNISSDAPIIHGEPLEAKIVLLSSEQANSFADNTAINQENIEEPLSVLIQRPKHHKAILYYQKQGMSIADTAKKLSITEAEVNLIVELEIYPEKSLIEWSIPTMSEGIQTRSFYIHSRAPILNSPAVACIYSLLPIH